MDEDDVESTSHHSAGVGDNITANRRSKKKKNHHHHKKKKKEIAELSTFGQFCATTSLHGWRFLSDANTGRPLKFGWCTVVMASLGVAFFFLANSMLDFLSSTVQTTQDTSRQARRITHIVIVITTHSTFQFSNSLIGFLSFCYLD